MCINDFYFYFLENKVLYSVLFYFNNISSFNILFIEFKFYSKKLSLLFILY